MASVSALFVGGWMNRAHGHLRGGGCGGSTPPLSTFGDAGQYRATQAPTGIFFLATSVHFSAILSQLASFGDFCHFLPILSILGNFWPFWPLLALFDHFRPFDHFFSSHFKPFWHFWGHFARFWLFLVYFDAF